MSEEVPDRPTEPLPQIDWNAQGIETEFAWALNAVLQAFSRTAIAAVADVPGGPRGYQILVSITTEEPSSQLLLAQRLRIDKTQMTYLIDDLESGGYVERRADPSDRRVRQIHPTETGESLLARARSHLRNVEGVLLRHLSPRQQTDLRVLLARVALGADDVEAEIDGPLRHPIAAPGRSRRTGTHHASR